ncbi:MAG: septum formation initiator family protein [Clostridiales bacterium]|nr:septum formation initiator family protein [Candidatus Cacconaster stercorequi]
MSSKKKGNKSRSIIVSLALVVLLVIMGVQLVHVFGQISSAKEKEAALSAQVEQRQRENTALKSDLARSDDPDFYQELARSELGLAQDGERIFYDVNN